MASGTIAARRSRVPLTVERRIPPFLPDLTSPQVVRGLTDVDSSSATEGNVNGNGRI